MEAVGPEKSVYKEFETKSAALVESGRHSNAEVQKLAYAYPREHKAWFVMKSGTARILCEDGGFRE